MASYRWEMVSCGGTCCTFAKRHGPYLYSYEGGRRSRKHLYGGRGGMFVDGTRPVEDAENPYAKIPENPHDGTPEGEIPPMDDEKALEMRKTAEERADRLVRAARRNMSRDERRRYDALQERMAGDRNEYTKLAHEERRVIARGGGEIPLGLRGRALAAVKAEIVAQLDAERQAVIEQLRAERRALTRQIAESRRELRKMLRPAKPDTA